jgi:arginase family enzyme
MLGLLCKIRYATNTKKKSAYLYCLGGGESTSLGDFKGAAEAYKKALSVFPECDDAKEQLADI